MDMPSSNIAFIEQLDCAKWQIDLPMVPFRIDVHDICGYLPIHFVVRQGCAEYIRFVLQRQKHCTAVGH